jgi:hypothetical protein
MASTSDDNGKNGTVMRNAAHTVKALALATQALHADNLGSLVTDVAPPLHVSTTFRYPKDAETWECEV